MWMLASWACAPPPSSGLEPLPDAVAPAPGEESPPSPARPPEVPLSSPRARPPRPAPPPAPLLPDPARQVVIRIDPGLERVRGGSLGCGSKKLEAVRAHDTIVFDDVPAGSCRLTLDGDDVSGVVLAGTWWHLVRRDASTLLLRE